MNIISTAQMPQANGHYSQCIEYQGILHLSGQLPIHPETRTIPDTVEEQADLALHNVALILREAGVSKNQVIQVRIYVSDIAYWDKVNERYAIFFSSHKPVRCIMPTRDLHFGCFLELEVTAMAQS